MNNRQLLAINTDYLLSNQIIQKIINKWQAIPFNTSQLKNVNKDTKITLKFRDSKKSITIIDQCSILEYKSFFCFKLDNLILNNILLLAKHSKYLFVFCEGTIDTSRIILYYDNKSESIFKVLEESEPTLRLQSFGLPPIETEVIDSHQIKHAIYFNLSKSDPELFSLHANRFLKDPHILTHLFSHVMRLDSQTNINYISVLKVVSDNLRDLLKPRIKSIKRDHNDIWYRYSMKRISYSDGGLSRIVSLPGTEPMGIRIGLYSVVPGETDLEKREKWNLFSHVIGDILTERSLIVSDDYQTDTKRLQEVARYILEPLTACNYVKELDPKPEVLFLHGPLQNKFDIYFEDHPHYIPGLNPEFLKQYSIDKEIIAKNIIHLPKDNQGNVIWNASIPIYAYIMKQIFKSDIPIVGVVERSGSNKLIFTILDSLVEDRLINESSMKKLKSKIKKYEFGEEFLFGCILNEGEYLEPVQVIKNSISDTHDRWRSVIANIPKVNTTVLKTSTNNFPFRVELNIDNSNPNFHDIMSLLYHTSLLLPNYAFPVGIDIVDKYAKIPDWLSKGLSARMTAIILNKVMQMGDDRMLRQTRQLLARSPRDFFYRPKI